MVSLAHLFLLSGCTLVINGQYAGIPKCAVPCAKTDCLNAVTPPGECCPVCPSTPPPHCAAVLCPKPDCLNPTTPPGECCPVCLATIPKCTVPCAKTDCLNAVTPPGECCPVCPSTPPPHCAAVLCPIPDCLNPSTPPGECCPVCLGKSCFHKGVRRQDGETFKDDCNTCTCNNGRVACTKIGCIEKPGKCPGSSGFEKCAKVSLCSGDSDCPGSQKCCSSKCGGSVCMPPVTDGKNCFHKGVRRQDGETFKDDCNTCTCNNGRVACTKIGCSTCGGIKCPQLRCANQYTPPGQCCAVCRPPGKPDIYAG